MKKIILISLALCFVVSTAKAEIVNTQGETKIANYLKQMVNTLESAREDGVRIYNDIKTYIIDHPTQFTSADKTKLNALQTQLTTIQNDINTFITTVETDFPGLK